MVHLTDLFLPIFFSFLIPMLFLLYFFPSFIFPYSYVIPSSYLIPIVLYLTKTHWGISLINIFLSFLIPMLFLHPILSPFSILLKLNRPLPLSILYTLIYLFYLFICLFRIYLLFCMSCLLSSHPSINFLFLSFCEASWDYDLEECGRWKKQKKKIVIRHPVRPSPLYAISIPRWVIYYD